MIINHGNRKQIRVHLYDIYKLTAVVSSRKSCQIYIDDYLVNDRSR